MEHEADRAPSAFVGREDERRRLADALAAARSGAGQLMLVAGAAGAGKTALVREFLGPVESEADSDSVVLATRCNYQTGSQDAYSPFRALIEDLLVKAAEVSVDTTDKILGKLRRVGIAAARALLEVAPDLLGSIIPLSGVAVRAGTALLGEFIPSDDGARPSGVPERSSIHEHYLAVLETITAQHLLVIVVEDLHWADRSSLDLLSFLVSDIGQRKILLIGTYRDDELVLSADSSEAPLTKILHEAETNGWADQINLANLTEDDVDQYIATVFPGNTFEDDIGQWVYNRTEGNALFVVQTLKQMCEVGHLENSTGHWVESDSITRPEYLPVTIEAVIQDRIQRLDPRSLKLLSCGSVQGTEFAAQVVASVVGDDDEQVVDDLVDALQRRHDLVEEHGERPLGQRRMVSLFQFTHSAIRNYIYEDYLVAAQRRRLHGGVGKALEELHGDHAELIAPVLAHHFVEAHEDDLAVHYLLLAADKALGARALPEARDLFRRAATISGDSLKSELVAEISRIANAEAATSARMCLLRWASYFCGEGQASDTSHSHVEQPSELLQQLTTALQPRLREKEADADEVYQVALRLLMFMSESAISEQDSELYIPIKTMNDLVTTYLDARDEPLASAFRLSYLAWIAENVRLSPDDVKELAVLASDRFHRIYEDDMSEARDAIEGAAFNAWRAHSFEKAAHYYRNLCDLVSLDATTASANAIVMYTWLAARNCAWAAERQPELCEEMRAELRRGGAELFARVADKLIEGGTASLSAPVLYRKALELGTEADQDRRSTWQGQLAAVEELNGRFGDPLHQAAIVGETYDKTASDENPLADRVVTWLREHRIDCVRECPADMSELQALENRYKLIIMQSGPRSPWPQGWFVFEIFGGVAEFDKLYLRREPFSGHWTRERGGATWLLFAGNGAVRTMDAADELLRTGVLSPIVDDVYPPGK